MFRRLSISALRITLFAFLSILFSFSNTATSEENAQSFSAPSAQTAKNISRQQLEIYFLDLKLYDEILTQSIRNYAFTREEKWLNRYYEHQPKIDALVLALKNSYLNGSKELIKFDKANNELYKLENNAIEAVKNDKIQQAIAILDSQEYEQNKQIYLRSIEVGLGLNQYNQQNGLNLTQEELDWLASHPVIKVQNEIDYFPYNFFDEEPMGYSVDYLRLLEQKLPVQFEFVPKLSWDESLNRLKSKKLELIVNIVESPERAKEMLFTESYLRSFNGIYVKQGTKKVSSLGDLSGKSVAVTRGFIEQELLTKYYPQVNIVEVESPLKAIEAVLVGDAYATISDTAQINYLVQYRSLAGLELSAIIADQRFQYKFSIAVRKDWPILRNILNKAINSVEVESRNNILKKWLVESTTRSWSEANLTYQEQNWLNAHRVWRIGIDPNAQPFEFVDNKGKHSGLSSEYIKYIASQLNIQLEYQEGATWSEVLDRIKEKELDVLPLAVNTTSSQSFLEFTDPYLQYPPAIVTQDSNSTINQQTDLSNKKVALIRNYPITEKVLSLQLDIVPIYVDNVLQAMKLVSSGQADAFIMGAATVTYQIKEANITNLKISGYADLELPGYSMAVRKDWQPLVGILNKALENIPLQKVNDFSNRWLDVKNQTTNLNALSLTPKEKEWISENSTIQIVRGINRFPFNFQENEKVTGFSVDYIKLVLDKIGMKYNVSKGFANDDLSSLKLDESDLLHITAQTFSTDRVILTRPYAVTANALVTRKNYKAISSLNELQGKTVAMVRQDELVQLINEKVSDVNFQFFVEDRAALNAVAYGQADASIADFPVANHLMKSASLNNLKFAGQIDPQILPANKYHLAISAKNPELKNILEKSMALVDRQESLGLEQKWQIESQLRVLEFSDEGINPTLRVFLIVTVCILIGSALLLIALKVLERSKQDPLKFEFSGAEAKKIALIFNATIISLTLFLSWWLLTGLKSKITRDTLASMQTVLETTNRATTVWVEAKLNSLKATAANQSLGVICEKLLTYQNDNQMLLNSTELEQFIQSINTLSGNDKKSEYFFIASDGTNLGALVKNHIGQKSLIATSKPDIFQRLLNGESLFIPPLTDVTSSTQLEGLNQPYTEPKLFFAVPVLNSQNRVIGILAKAYSPNANFSHIHKAGRIGRSGETYSVSAEGKLLSESRYESQLALIGLLKPNQSSISLTLNDPSLAASNNVESNGERNFGALTAMAQEISKKNSGFDIQGYNNYRGSKVIGVWTWNDQLGIGMATEIDYSEAFQGYTQSQFVMLMIVIITISTSVLFSLMTMLLGSRTTRALKKAADSLERRVEERTEELQISENHLRKSEHRLKDALKMANSANQAKSEFLATMSHEIRTPLNGVLGMLSLLKHTELSDEQDRKLDIAKNSAESLLAIINEILDFSKIESGKLELESVDFSLTSVLEELAQTMAFKADEKDIEIVLDVTQVKTNWVKGDPYRIRQVLVNLIGNAIKFTEHGEIVIKARLDSLDDSSSRLTCSVSDSGIGISKTKLATLFDAFTQADTSTTRKYGGSGLGLAICKKLVEMMSGTIEVSSEVNEGSSFTFTVLLSPAEEEQKASFPKIDMSDLNILIVDDNETNREIFSSYIELWGAKSEQVSNAEKAIEICKDTKNKRFDMALIDMHMPEMNGEMLAGELRKNDELNDMKLLLLTSMTKMKTNEEIKALGFDGYLNKPLASSDLFNAIAALKLQSENLSKPQLVTEAMLNSIQTKIPASEFAADVAWPTDLRILLVEDNQVNQLVVQGMLDVLGLSCDFAGNGLEAIANLKRAPEDSPFNLIFMDCQMPELDGYEATERIRQGLAGERYKDTTIIALTAHAMKTQLEKCIEIGMDDYLKKPLDEIELKRSLIKWVVKPNQQSHNPEQNQEKATSEQKTPNISDNTNEVDKKIENAAEWDERALSRRLSDNQRLIEQLQTLFLGQMPDNLAKLRKAIDRDDRHQVTELSHLIKGMSGNFSALKLHAIAAHLESNGDHLPAELLMRYFSQIELSFNAIKNKLKDKPAAESSKPEEKLPLDKTYIKDWMSDLQSRLEDGEAVLPKSLQDIEKFNLPSNISELIEQLKQQLALFDTDNAIDTVKLIDKLLE